MYPLIKRPFDFVVAAIGVLLLAPLYITVAILIKSTSEGPVFYRGLRTGRYGRPFHIIKFRTMVANAESLGGTTTGKDDPRVTGVGRVLRKFKIDELPQLFNVLSGDMSLVGPRPEVAEYTDHFTDEEKRIFSVRPGITDLASIEFSDLQEWVGAADPDKVFRERILPEKNRLRLKYVDERSLWTDLSILLKTLAVVLGKVFKRRAACNP